MAQTKLIKVDPLHPNRASILEAALVLRNGGLVAFPTETVYGLGANAYDKEAVKKVFEAKMRPPDNPLIVHISKIEHLGEIALDVPEKAYKLIERAWPGPLTLILRKSPKVPPEVTGGMETVAVRMPAHPVALELIEQAGVPVAAPSANLSGRPSPTTAEHVVRDLWGRVDVILDGGETFLGVESTVLNILSEPPALLRPGPVSVEDLEAILGEKISVPEWARGYSEQIAPLSPGVKYKHYSPSTPIILVEAPAGEPPALAGRVLAAAEEETEKGKKVAIISSSENAEIYERRGFATLVLGSRANIYEVAKNLYKVLREVDELGVDVAICEGFEERGIGLAVMNRLRKASTQILRA